MADIFSNMFFCHGLDTESPRSSVPPPPPQRNPMAGQDLSEYLKAYRNKETVDESWKRVHEKGRGKKRFKKLVNKQIMVSRMKNLGVQEQSSSKGGRSERFKPRGSIHQFFLSSDLEKLRLDEIARANEEKKKKREEYLRQNKGGADDRESLSSGQSRKRKKWRPKKDKNGLNDDTISDSSSIDLEASMRSLELAFKIREPIDEMNEDSDENDDENNSKTAEEENENDTEEDDGEKDEAENNDTENEDDNEQDSEVDKEQNAEDDDEEDEKEEATHVPNKSKQQNRGNNQDLIPPPDNLPIFVGKRRGSDKSTGSEGKNTPIKLMHRSPRSNRRVAPELTVAPVRARPVSRDLSPSLAKPKLVTPRPSPRHFPASSNKTPAKTPKKDLKSPLKKPLTQPKDPFTSRRARKARPELVKANPQANTVNRTGGAGNLKLFDKSPSRSLLGAPTNTGSLQKSPAKRAAEKPAARGQGGNKDKKEGGVPMQNYGTCKF